MARGYACERVEVHLAQHEQPHTNFPSNLVDLTPVWLGPQAEMTHSTMGTDSISLSSSGGTQTRHLHPVTLANHVDSFKLSGKFE